MTEAVLDASAVLALLFRETGHERVEACLPDSVISAANYSEVAARLVHRGAGCDEIEAMLSAVMPPVVAVDREIGLTAGFLRKATSDRGLSLGDRLCLATAKVREGTAVTADRAWLASPTGVNVDCIR